MTLVNVDLSQLSFSALWYNVWYYQHQLLVRWFQFGAFTPIYRVHGGGSNTEIWNYGPDVEVVHSLLFCEMQTTTCTLVIHSWCVLRL